MREIKKEVVYDFIEAFINSMPTNMSDELSALQKEAIDDNIPIVKPDVINLLKTMLQIKKPKRILEVGTAYAFSALLMCEILPDVDIVTIERDERMASHARVNIEKFGKQSNIRLLEGDGVEMLKSLDEKFDLVFIDASKSHYNEFMTECKRMLDNDGLIIADNVLYKGLVAKDRYDVVKRDRTIHRRMREFISDAYADTNFNTCIMPTGDGILMSAKK